MDLIQAIEDRLTADDKKQLMSIYAPVEVAKPYEFSSERFTVTRSGEIRYYEHINGTVSGGKGEASYLVSVDGGLSWKRRTDVDEKALGRCVYIPELDLYAEIRSIQDKGTFAYISKLGPDDTEYETYKVSDDTFNWFKSIICIPETGKLIALTEKDKDGVYYTVVLISDFNKDRR